MAIKLHHCGEQRMCSLAVANRARAARTALKNKLAIGRASIEDVLIFR